MLDNLSGRLAGVVKNLRGQARITEANVQDTLRQVRLALLEADVSLPVARAPSTWKGNQPPGRWGSTTRRRV